MSAQNVWRTVWTHKSLLAELIRRDWQNRYVGSMGGRIWLVVNPLIMLGMYSLVFEVVFKIKLPGGLTDYPFVLFMAVVYWPWLAFQDGCLRATSSVINHAALVKKVAFPRELLVYAAVTAAFATHLLGYGVAMMVLAMIGYGLHLEGLVVSCLVWVLLYLLSMSVGLVLAGVQVFVRDTEHVVAQILMLLFYGTPILYPLSMVPEWIAHVLAFNPLAHLLEWLRAAWLTGQMTNWNHVLSAIFILVVVLGLGRFVFVQLASHFEDAL